MSAQIALSIDSTIFEYDASADCQAERLVGSLLFLRVIHGQIIAMANAVTFEMAERALHLYTD